MTDFFIFCSGVHPNFVKRSPSETNKYVGIGATVLFTGILAFFSASYAFYTVFNSYVLAIGLGLIWGLMIFNLDRYIVSSIKKADGLGKQMVMAFPRLLFAGLIALVISKPIEMKLFESEINGEIVSMQQEQYKAQEDLLKARFEDDENKILNEIRAIESDLRESENYKNQLLAESIAEADGTGGSEIRNMGPIYKMKKAEADKANLEYEEATAKALPLISLKNEQLESIRNNRNLELAKMQKIELTGFASRLKALHALGEKHNEIYIAGIFIMLLFIALETAPIFVKLISSRGPLDYVQNKHEAGYVHSHDLLLEKLKLDKSYHSKTKSYAMAKAVECENIVTKEALEAELEASRKEGFTMASIKAWRNKISDALTF